MRLRLLVIWITFTALLQWSRAQEDNMQAESPEPEEEKPLDMQEDMNITPGEDHTTTALPEASNLEIVPPDPVEPLTETGDMPNNGTQGEEHPGEDKKEERPVGLDMGTQDMPSDGSMISVMDPLSAEVPIVTPSPPPDKEKPTTQEAPSSEADSHIPKDPPTSSEGEKLPDYQDDTPIENNSPKPEPTPPVPAPVYRYQNCYSCLNCNATVTDDQKTICKAGAGGCFTMLVKNKNLLPTQKNYVERGCSSELSDAFIRYCKDNKELCLRCEANYCNVHDMTKLQQDADGSSSSSEPRLLSSLLIGSICLASCWRRQVL